MYGVMPKRLLVATIIIKRKFDVFDVFIQFQAHVERLLKQKIIHVQSDWGVNTTTSTRFLTNL